MQHFHHLILGTGQATGTLLGDLLPTGNSIAVIEGGRIGGTCVNTGCTPTKALVASAKVAHMARRAPEYGVNTNGVEIDYVTSFMGQGFTFKNPSASGGCGCGSSFTV